MEAAHFWKVGAGATKRCKSKNRQMEERFAHNSLAASQED